MPKEIQDYVYSLYSSSLQPDGWCKKYTCLLPAHIGTSKITLTDYNSTLEHAVQRDPSLGPIIFLLPLLPTCVSALWTVLGVLESPCIPQL